MVLQTNGLLLVGMGNHGYAKRGADESRAERGLGRPGKCTAHEEFDCHVIPHLEGDGQNVIRLWGI